MTHEKIFDDTLKWILAWEIRDSIWHYNSMRIKIATVKVTLETHCILKKKKARDAIEKKVQKELQ